MMKILRMKNNTVANREERINEKLKKPSPRMVKPLAVDSFHLNQPSGSLTNKNSYSTLPSPGRLNTAINTLSNGL